MKALFKKNKTTGSARMRNAGTDWSKAMGGPHRGGRAERHPYSQRDGQDREHPVRLLVGEGEPVLPGGGDTRASGRQRSADRARPDGPLEPGFARRRSPGSA